MAWDNQRILAAPAMAGQAKLRRNDRQDFITTR